MTTGVPAIMIGSMTLPIEVGLLTGTAQQPSASDHQYHPFQDLALHPAAIRAVTFNPFQGPGHNGKALVPGQAPAYNGKASAPLQAQADRGRT